MPDLAEQRASHFFRARIGRERGPIIRSYNWDGVLEIGEGVLNLLSPSKRVESVRSTGLAFLSGISMIFPLILTMRQLGNYLAMIDLTVALAVLGSYLLALLLGAIMLGYLMDYFFLRIEPRYSKVVAVLKLNDVCMGTFRHSLNCIVEEQPFGQKYKGKELQLTVVATRKGLKAALASMTKPASTSPSL